MTRDAFVPPRKLGYGPLALLDWLCSAGPGARMVSVHTYNRGGCGSTLYEIAPGEKHGLRRLFPAGDPGLLQMLGGRDVTDLSSLRGYGLHYFQRQSHERRDSPEHLRQGIPPETYRAIMERHSPEAFGYTDSVYVPSARTLELWRDGVRAEAARRREERAAAAAASRRLVLVQVPWTSHQELPPDLAARMPRGISNPFRARPVKRPYALVEVVRETEGRVYVGSVEHLPAPGGSFAYGAIRGNEPNRYVDRSDILVDGIERGAALRIARIHEDDASDRRAALAKAVSEIVGPLRNWADRELQKDAEREALLAEALGAEAEPPAPGR